MIYITCIIHPRIATRSSDSSGEPSRVSDYLRPTLPRRCHSSFFCILETVIQHAERTPLARHSSKRARARRRPWLTVSRASTTPYACREPRDGTRERGRRIESSGARRGGGGALPNLGKLRAKRLSSPCSVLGVTLLHTGGGTTHIQTPDVHIPLIRHTKSPRLARRSGGIRISARRRHGQRSVQRSSHTTPIYKLSTVYPAL